MKLRIHWLDAVLLVMCLASAFCFGAAGCLFMIYFTGWQP